MMTFYTDDKNKLLLEFRILIILQITQLISWLKNISTVLRTLLVMLVNSLLLDDFARTSSCEIRMLQICCIMQGKNH